MKTSGGIVTVTLLALSVLAIAAPQASAPPAQPAATGSSASSTPQSSPQNPPTSAQAPPDKNEPEISTHEETAATFKVKVNLVQVRVVVRDAQGNAKGNLKQEDFQLTDNGKPQIISRFSMDQAVKAAPSPAPSEKPEPATDQLVIMPVRYVAYLFDDIHVNASNLSRARMAALHELNSLQPTDRAAIYTTSGQVQLDFTDDRAQLQETLNRLLPRPVTGSGVRECPDVSYYMADQIMNKHDAQALLIVAGDAVNCLYGGDQSKLQRAENEARAAAMQELDLGNHETRLTLEALLLAVEKTAARPGQRTVIFVSPGFYNPENTLEQNRIVEHALRTGVVISSLDARGLNTVGYEGSMQGPQSGWQMQFLSMESLAEQDAMSDLAYATGGKFFRNNNDLDAGCRDLAPPPEYSYLLGFSPQNLKMDGSYHHLKVTLKGPEKLNIQARKGYYAPKQAADPTEQARQEIEDAVFSRDEISDIPVQLHTQFYKSSEDEAKVSVIVRLDPKHLQFRKLDGRNRNNVTVVAALFDRNGNFLSGKEKILELRLKDETLEHKLASGLTLKSTFDVKPGDYVIRLVVRDDNGQLAAQNDAIKIP